MEHHNERRPVLVALVLAAAVMAVDQATKFLADAAGVLNFEMMLGLASAPPWPTIVLGSLAILTFGAHTLRLTRLGWLSPIIPALLVGGGGGNLLDRLSTGGGVHDFIRTGGLVWNVADLAIAIGLVGYVTTMLRTRDRRADGPSALGKLVTREEVIR